MKKLLALPVLLLLFTAAHAQHLRINTANKFSTSSNMPFFWLGDTAWELFHRLTFREAKAYLEDRARKGFTVIQCVALAELDGLETPNANGQRPLVNNDPTKPNEAYFKFVDSVVNEAARLGLTIAMLPSWGDKWFKNSWGIGPEIFTPQNARIYGEFIGRRYAKQPIVWVLGGDRSIEDDTDRQIIVAMAEGLKKGDGGTHLMTFHPPGGKSSSDYFTNDKWLDFHMSQTGHSSETKPFEYNERHRTLQPLKPHVDGEPRYEDHPNQFNPEKFGWMDDFDARQTGYWNILSGAAGHTYGNHNIWQFYTEKHKAISWARTHWKQALHHTGSTQVGLMRKMFEKRNWQSLEPDQSVVLSPNDRNVEYVTAAVSKNKDLLMAYLPYGKPVKIRTGAVDAKSLNCWWFNPRDGRSIFIGKMENNGEQEFKPHSIGRGSDWLLIVEDASKQYPDPAVAQ